jgi:hypothetical protein
MRAIRIALFASLAATLAACGGGSEKEPDAMVIPLDAAPDAPPDAPAETANLTCVGNTQPAAPANVTLSGFAAEVVLGAGGAPDVIPAHGATVQICKASSTTCMNTDQLFTVITPASGCPASGCAWNSGALATGGTPLDVYGKVSKGSNLPTFIYPAAPLTAGFMNAPGIMLTAALIQLLPAAGITQDPAKGILLLAATDCANLPLSSNVTQTVKQGGVAVAGTDDIDLGTFDPSLAGTHAIFNVPAGVTEVSGMYKTTALRAHEVRVVASSTTATQLRPGF